MTLAWRIPFSQKAGDATAHLVNVDAQLASLFCNPAALSFINVALSAPEHGRSRRCKTCTRVRRQRGL